MGGFRRRAAAGALGVLTLAGVVYGTAAAQAQADGVTTAGPACPGRVGGTTVSAGPAHWAAGVPWRSVGKGWILADLARSQAATGPGTLYLVSPGGKRYRLGTAPAGATLADWSGNGTNALFFADQDGSVTATVTVLNLHTGRAASFRAYSSDPFPGLEFSRPGGTAILFQAGTTGSGASLPLQRLSLTGSLELCYPARFSPAGAFDGEYRENASGTELVLSTRNGLELVTNGGQPIRGFAIQREPDSCDLLNWWSSTSVLADCAGQLLAYPLSGARPAQLTTSRDAGIFLGAWHLASGTYAEAAACGTTWLERLNRNGTATRLTIPGAASAGTVQPLGTFGSQLPLLIGGGCDGHFAYSIVDWYNPGTNVARTVIGGPAAGGGYVANAVLFPAS
jgi:hypothetical protein